MKAVIIEDEILIARELKFKIEQVAPDIEILEMLPSLKTSRKWFMQNPEPDLIFMDIQLSDGVSFELFDMFRLSCPVIFTTAYDAFAVKAFRSNGIDYLLKPIDTEELSTAIAKCRQFLGKHQPQGDLKQLLELFSRGKENTGAYKEKFIVHYRNSWVPVSTGQIACFLRDNLNYLVSMEGEHYALEYDSLDEVESLLDPQQFFRANRQCIININAIQRVTPHDNQKLSVYLTAMPQAPIDISREKAPAFRKWLDR
jgi:DNA-binding LytR/AlgR family response regulator